jgi:hypothetical protein
VIYDRRQLTNANTDPDVAQISKDTITNLRRFYGQRLGIVYVLHVNWLFWFVYQCLRPLLACLKLHTKFVIVNKIEGRYSSTLYTRT